jgi:N-acetylneuraminic acid mutarotase
VAALNGKLYAAAGRTAPNRVYVYDPATDQWTRIADLPSVQFEAVAAAVAERLYVIGGADDAFAPVRTVDVLRR